MTDPTRVPCPHCGKHIVWQIATPEQVRELEAKRARYGEHSGLITRAARDYGVEPSSILSKRRTASVSNARAIVAYVLRQQGNSLTTIGRVLDRDHSTVMAMIAKVETRMAESIPYAARVRRIAAENDREAA